MDLDDDDAPPPLSSLSEQVEALRRQTETSSGRSSLQEERLRIASTCVITEGSTGKRPQPASKPVIKKGFFDTPVSKKTPTTKAGTLKADTITSLKGQKQAIGSGPNIPDFLRVGPDEDELKYKEMRTKLVDALKPDADTIAKIGSNQQLAAAFDDPDVMAAVNDIAQNPQNFKKYQDNKKVIAFYSAMGAMMGQKLEGMAEKQPGPAKQ